MRAELIGEFEPQSPEWHQARAAGLGGSEIAAVMGLNPWESAFSLWHRKAGRIGPKEQTAAMSWGKRLEPAIAAKWSEDHPEFRTRHTGTWRSRERHWQIANPDRLLLTPSRANNTLYEPTSILEVKTAHGMDAHAWGDSGTDEIPVYYRCQVLWYLDVFGFDRCDVAVLIGGSDYREYAIGYDPAEAAIMRDEAEIFLASIEAGDRPDIDSADTTYQVIRQLHPDIDGTEKEIPLAAADHYLSACEIAKAAADEKQYAAAIVLDHMGSAQYALRAGERFAQRVALGDDRTPHLRPTQKRRNAA